MADYMLDLRMGVDAKLNASTVEVNESTAGTISYAVDNRNLRIDAKKTDGTFEKQLINADLAYGIRDKEENIIAEPGEGKGSLKVTGEGLLYKRVKIEKDYSASYSYYNILYDDDYYGENSYFQPFKQGEYNGIIFSISKWGGNSMYVDTPLSSDDLTGKYINLIIPSSDTSGYLSFSQGLAVTASGTYSHAEGTLSEASGLNSHAEGYGTIASHEYTHAEGFKTKASAMGAHAEGYETIAKGFKGAHAEGAYTLANSYYTHAEGLKTEVHEAGSHVEGTASKVIHTPFVWSGFLDTGSGIHAEGHNTMATDTGAHSEGYNTFAAGEGAHAEGSGIKGGLITLEDYTKISDTVYKYSYEYGGSSDIFIGDYIYGEFRDSEGEYYDRSKIIDIATDYLYLQYRTDGNEYYLIKGGAIGIGAHTEGIDTIAFDDGAHSEGYYSKAYSENSHAEGTETIAGLDYLDTPNIYSKHSQHAEGAFGAALGLASHVEGGLNPHWDTQDVYEGMSGFSNVVGDANTTTYTYQSLDSVSIGDIFLYGKQIYTLIDLDTTNSTFTLDKTINEYEPISIKSFYRLPRHYALGNYSHAEGHLTCAIGDCSHSEGEKTKAIGYYSHAEGQKTQAIGSASHASGLGTIANLNNMTVVGQYNKEIEDVLFVVGNGTNSSNRSNAMLVQSDGSTIINGSVYAVDSTSEDKTPKELATVEKVQAIADAIITDVWYRDVNPPQIAKQAKLLWIRYDASNEATYGKGVLYYFNPVLLTDDLTDAQVQDVNNWIPMSAIYT